MEVLVEVHDEAELQRAVALGTAMIGINNRDLRTLEVDLATTERLAPLIPSDRLIVAASGIADRSDVARLAPFADAFLVGTALMRAARPAEAARALAFGRVKVCGLTNAADFDMAVAAGATHAGLVMVPGTPRAVTAAQAEAILGAAKSNCRTVGIFRDADPAQVNAAARGLGLHAVQLHGDEEVGACRALLPAETELWAAVKVGAGTTGPRAGADRMLFDSGAGGTGRTFDWSRVAGRPELKSGLLAGGLHPGNARAAAGMGAYALDVGSGLEAVAGWKDSNRVAAFFAALRLPARGEAAIC
jgi:indole-3-glycerol phosphate synthase/phosphoribosylanthranilate isomerase